jgi:hypothetical protein
MGDDDIVLGEKCGACKYAVRAPDGKGYECFGEPPTVMPMAAGPDALGRPVITLQMFNPRVEKDRIACSLFDRRPMVFDATRRRDS